VTSSLRQALVPLEHVYAELLAFPLASEAAFRAGLDRLEPGPSGGAGDRLWQGFEQDLFHTLPALSVDEMACLRDRVWYGAPGSEGGPLHAYLRRHAAGLLRACGNVAEPRPSCDGAEPETYLPADSDDEEAMVVARRRWRWVTFALPADLILAGLAGESPPGRVDTLSPALRAILGDQGYAETHLHVGAAVSFPDLWASLMWTLAQPGCRADRFASSGAVFEHGERFGGWLLRAALARCALAAYLATGRLRHGSLARYLLDEVAPRVRDEHGPAVAQAYLTGLNELHDGRPAARRPEWEDLWRVYRGLYESLAGKADGLGSLGRVDPVSELLGWRDGDPEMPEARWVRAGLRWMEGHPADAGFARLFWQSVRVRCLYYRYVVQRPMTPGLHWFLRFYGRIWSGRGWFDHEGGRPVASALRMQGDGDGLRSLEVRVAPGRTWGAMADFLREVALAGRDGRAEFGVVLHFIKDRGDRIALGFPSPHGAGGHADPARRSPGQAEPNPTGYRYAEYHRSRVEQAEACAELFGRHPAVIRWVRGVDVCNDERAIPNWVLAGPYRRVVEAGQAASRRLGDGTPPIRRTVHIGEDFVHPLSGLRTVSETVRFFELRDGDRLGHALALGVDMRDWAERAGRVALRREERLFDLAWEWLRCSQRRAPGPDRLPYVQREIRRLSAAVLGDPHAPDVIVDLVADLHTPARLRAVGFPDGVREPEHRATARRDRLLFRYLTSSAVFRDGQATEWVSVRDEGPILAALQAGVRREVGRRGVVVEVNPSSNLLIGEFGDLRRHPFWRLAGPPGAAADPDAPPLTVCLGSDDPILFATDIRQEYQLVFDALVSAGNSTEETCRWVERLRASGMAARFTLARPRT
jgi:hypothetical protein